MDEVILSHTALLLLRIIALLHSYCGSETFKLGLDAIDISLVQMEFVIARFY